MVSDWLDTSVIFRTMRGVTRASPVPAMEIQLNDVVHKAILHHTLWLWAPFLLVSRPMLISNTSPNSGLAQKDTVLKKKKAKDNPGEQCKVMWAVCLKPSGGTATFQVL